MKLSNPPLFCFVYRGQQANDTAVAQTPMRCGRSNLSLEDILSPPANDSKIGDIGEELDNHRGMRRTYPRSFLIMKTGFQKFEWKRQKRIIRQQ
jgi:hypothetical protein